MNGRPWTEADTATLRRMAGKKSYAAIAARTGHKERTVREHATQLGLQPYRPGRRHWTRRDWLLADAAGLDFQMTG